MSVLCLSYVSLDACLVLCLSNVLISVLISVLYLCCLYLMLCWLVGVFCIFFISFLYLFRICFVIYFVSVFFICFVTFNGSEHSNLYVDGWMGLDGLDL